MTTFGQVLQKAIEFTPDPAKQFTDQGLFIKQIQVGRIFAGRLLSDVVWQQCVVKALHAPPANTPLHQQTDVAVVSVLNALGVCEMATSALNTEKLRLVGPILLMAFQILSRRVGASGVGVSELYPAWQDVLLNLSILNIMLGDTETAAKFIPDLRGMDLRHLQKHAPHSHTQQSAPSALPSSPSSTLDTDLQMPLPTPEGAKETCAFRLLVFHDQLLVDAMVDQKAGLLKSDPEARLARWTKLMDGADAPTRSLSQPLRKALGLSLNRQRLLTCFQVDCNKQESRIKQFLQCSRCSLVVYCSAACQKAAWKEHKVHCR